MGCKNDSCNCMFQTKEQVEDVIKRIEAYRHFQSLKYVRNLKYGYNAENTFHERSPLYLYLRTLRRHYEFLALNRPTNLSCKEVSGLFQAVNQIVNLSECSPITDNTADVTKDEAWIVLHPDCIPKEKWQRCMGKMFPKLTLTATPLTPSCETIVIELLRTDVFCDLVIELQKRDFETEDCVIEFQVLKEILPECNIEFELFKTLAECGISTELIKKVVDCDLQWSVTNEGIPCIIDINGGQLTLKDIDGIDTGCLT